MSDESSGEAERLDPIVELERSARAAREHGCASMFIHVELAEAIVALLREKLEASDVVGEMNGSDYDRVCKQRDALNEKLKSVGQQLESWRDNAKRANKQNAYLTWQVEDLITERAAREAAEAKLADMAAALEEVEAERDELIKGRRYKTGTVEVTVEWFRKGVEAIKACARPHEVADELRAAEPMTDDIDTKALRTHTPGPWFVDRVDEDSGMIGWWIHSEADHIVNVYDEPGDPHARANAHLIAAAPDLLKKVVDLKRQFDEERRKANALKESVRDTVRDAVEHLDLAPEACADTLVNARITAAREALDQLAKRVKR